MVFVQVGGDNDLEPVAPHLLCQLHTDLMAPLRGDFTRLETLIAMPCDILVLFAITPELEHRKSGYVERKRRPYQGNVVRIA